MKKFILFTVLFLLSISLVAAVDVSTSKTDYASGETAIASISGCAGTSIVEFLNPGGILVDIKSGQGSWTVPYNTLSDSEDGKYTVTASCSNEQAQANFCVDAQGCLGQAPVTEEKKLTEEEQQKLTEEEKKKKEKTCTPDWSCNVWSFCGPDSLQKRSCTDRNNCKAPKDETRPCAPCQESWICSEWSECQVGSQSRVCYDEHFCETTNYQPHSQKGCEVFFPPGPEPDRISFQLPPPYAPAAAAEEESFFQKYKLYLLGLLIAAVLTAIILLAIHYFKPKKVAYNINELKQWVRKEKEMGTSDENIREILKQNTGWTDEEIDMAFESLRTQK